MSSSMLCSYWLDGLTNCEKNSYIDIQPPFSKIFLYLYVVFRWDNLEGWFIYVKNLKFFTLKWFFLDNVIRKKFKYKKFWKVFEMNKIEEF